MTDRGFLGSPFTLWVEPYIANALVFQRNEAIAEAESLREAYRALLYGVSSMSSTGDAP